MLSQNLNLWFILLAKNSCILTIGKTVTIGKTKSLIGNLITN